MSISYYIYDLMFATCLVLTLRSLYYRQWEQASGYAAGTIFCLLALYIATFWNA